MLEFLFGKKESEPVVKTVSGGISDFIGEIEKSSSVSMVENDCEKILSIGKAVVKRQQDGGYMVEDSRTIYLGYATANVPHIWSGNQTGGKPWHIPQDICIDAIVNCFKEIHPNWPVVTSHLEKLGYKYANK